VDPADKFAYVTNFNSNDVSMYTIDAATGTLTFTGSIAAGTNPNSIAVDPAG
jgi:YVTN family beta-propeller protein